MSLTAVARHDCGARISYSDFIAGVCSRCGLLVEEIPPGPDWHEYICTNGHRLISAQSPDCWVGRVCGAVIAAPLAVGDLVQIEPPSPPCEGRWHLK